MMQKDKTLHFWDDFYRTDEAVAKEWIVQPSDALVRTILDQLSAKVSCREDGSVANSSFVVLEIGCGTSSLAADLCAFWNCHHKKSEASSIGAHNIILNVLATDVSPVCIAQQLELRQEKIKKCVLASATLEYRVLNITEPNQELNGRFDLIVDKGCLDTCLFRSKKADTWVVTVLRNLHSWLRTDSGVYVIVTPRSKLKAVRDYPGFLVTRTALSAEEYGNGDLEPRGGDKHDFTSKEQKQYMYICRRVNN